MDMEWITLVHAIQKTLREETSGETRSQSALWATGETRPCAAADHCTINFRDENLLSCHVSNHPEEKSRSPGGHTGVL